MLWHEDWVIAAHDNGRVVFADEKKSGSMGDNPGEKSPPGQEGSVRSVDGNSSVNGYCWKMLVVDDSQDVQSVTNAVLRNFVFEGKPLRQIFASSGLEAQRVAAEHDDLALILMDVVMESDHAGLDAVRYIRESLGNRFVRIVLRTGQPGYAPEEKVISEYDINDYREKADLSVRQLRSLVTTNLRNYRDLRAIERLALTNRELDGLIRERAAELEEINQTLVIERDELLRAQGMAHLGSWVWHVGGDRFAWTGEARRLLDCPEGESASFHRMINAISATDREQVRRVILNAMEGGESGFCVEHRVGTILVRHCGEIFRQGHGRVLRVEGTILDISGYKSGG